MSNRDNTPSFDVIIVGGGSAGAVLANRLSADPSRHVLLVEAGKAYPPNAYPDPVRRQDLVGGDPQTLSNTPTRRRGSLRSASCLCRVRRGGGLSAHGGFHDRASAGCRPLCDEHAHGRPAQCRHDASGRWGSGTPNLTIRDETLVDAVIVQGGRATRVRLASGEEITAGEIVLSAGTYVSPAILMRSGIGPAETLRGLGIPVVADLPVGRRLQDHPVFPTVWSIRKESVGLAYPPIGAMLWERSRHAIGDEADINISSAALPDAGQSPTGAMFLLFAALVRPRSVGSLTIASRNPQAAPVIDLGFLRDAEDRQRLIDGVEMIQDIAGHKPLADIIGAEMVPGAAVNDRASISAALAPGVVTYQHPTSTVPMGGAGDPNAVVDVQGRVRGISGLRVVDASLWPDVPSVATAFPTMMLAESIAAKMV